MSNLKKVYYTNSSEYCSFILQLKKHSIGLMVNFV